MKSVIGRVKFLTVEEGGQNNLPRDGFSNPVIFDDDRELAHGMWSIRVNLITRYNESREAIARFSFLFSENPAVPNHLLYEGSRFVFLTNRPVAQCHITHVIEEGKNSWFCPGIEAVIAEGLCWEYCFADNISPLDATKELNDWIQQTRKFKDISDFHKVCQICTHCQWS